MSREREARRRLRQSRSWRGPWRSQLNRKFVLTRIAVADEFLRAHTEVLLGAPGRLERGRCRLFRIHTAALSSAMFT